MIEFTYIYGLVDPRTNRVRYVGKSHDPERRLRHHVDRRAKDDERNQRKSAWLCGLVDAGMRPRLVIFERCAVENWQERESFWILAFHKEGDGLVNVSKGGNGLGVATPEMRLHMRLSNAGRTLSDEHKAKIAAAHRGRKRGPFHESWRRKMSEARRGKKRGPMSNEAKAKLSKAATGRRLSDEVRARLRERYAGKPGPPITPEGIAKMRAALTGRKLSDEHKRHISERGKGQKRSPETCERIRQSKLAFYARKKESLTLTAATS